MEARKYGRDIEWSLVYQLMYPDEEKYDAFGRPCKDVLAWQASRYPVSSREIFIDNTTRPDAREEDGMLWYKNTEKPIPYAVAMDERGGTGTDFFHARQGRWDNSIGVNGSYNLIMPYWIAATTVCSKRRARAAISPPTSSRRYSERSKNYLQRTDKTIEPAAVQSVAARFIIYL